jgi:FtsZ-binding cell division protein ZapB
MAKSTDEILGRIDEKLDSVVDSIHKVDKEVALQKAAFDDHSKQDEKMFSSMYDELKRMNDILQQNTNSLQEHMHRTDLLEELVKRIDVRLSPIEQERIENDAIVKYRNKNLKKIGKILGIITTAIGIIVVAKPFLLKLLSL